MKGKKDLPFWLTGREASARAPFARVSKTLLTDPAFRALTPTAQHVYLCMTVEAAKNRRFAFTRKTAAQYGIPARSLLRAVHDLTAAGFITAESGRTTREANIYQFLLQWKACT